MIITIMKNVVKFLLFIKYLKRLSPIYKVTAKVIKSFKMQMSNCSFCNSSQKYQ